MKFSKYSSAGNDFLLIDEKEGNKDAFSARQWEQICSRGTGVGADGVLFFSRNPFKMHYINADGHPAEMCGNGLRAICHYIAHQEPALSWPIQVETDQFTYRADKDEVGIWVEMADLSSPGGIDCHDLYSSALDSYYVNTGVPHAVFEVKNIEQLSLLDVAPAIRHDQRFKEGTNVDFFEEIAPGQLKMRVFERGVENETLSSGTGTTAVALAYRHLHQFSGDLKIQPPGGLMQVRFKQGVPWLTGPVEEVYQAQLSASFVAALS